MHRIFLDAFKEHELLYKDKENLNSNLSANLFFFFLVVINDCSLEELRKKNGIKLLGEKTDFFVLEKQLELWDILCSWSYNTFTHYLFPKHGSLYLQKAKLH